MADWPQDNTARFFLDYEGDMGKRTVQFRPLGAATESAMITEIAGLINILKAIIYPSVTFNSLRVAVAGSNVTNPVTGWTPILGTASSTLSTENYPRFVSFVGRDTTGNKVRMSFYGTNVSISADYRLLVGENTTIAAAVSYLNDGSRLFGTIANHKPIFKNYANQGFNAYHQRKRRAVA